MLLRASAPSGALPEKNPLFEDFELNHKCHPAQRLPSTVLRSSQIIQTPFELVSAAGKLTGLDKKLSRSLDMEVQMGSSPVELSMSPVGPLSESSR